MKNLYNGFKDSFTDEVALSSAKISPYPTTLESPRRKIKKVFIAKKNIKAKKNPYISKGKVHLVLSIIYRYIKGKWKNLHHKVSVSYSNYLIYSNIYYFHTDQKNSNILIIDLERRDMIPLNLQSKVLSIRKERI